MQSIKKNIQNFGNILFFIYFFYIFFYISKSCLGFERNSATLVQGIRLVLHHYLNEAGLQYQTQPMDSGGAVCIKQSELYKKN